MTVNHLVTGSNPVFGAILDRTPKIWTSNDFLSPNSHQNQIYDTSKPNYDTTPLRLYKVNNTYYYRRRIKQKLIRISLQTKNIKDALKRKRVLDLLSGDELMFHIEQGDFKLIFEYDTEEELRIALQMGYQMQIEAKVQRYKEVKTHLEHAEQAPISDATFETLRDKYIASKKKDDKVGVASITAYNGTFNILMKYFKDKQLHTITHNDFDVFKDYLIDLNNMKNKNINKHLMYLKQFIKFAKIKKLVASNEAEGITYLDELKDEIARKQEVRNYTDEEVRAILNYTYRKPVYTKVFKILAYTGMRPADLYDIKNANIRKEDGIHYFNITDGKTLNSIRKVPIHNEILEMVLSTSFPLFENQEHDTIGKKVRLQLYKVIDKESDLNLRTFRGTFIEKAIANNIELNNLFPLLQDTVGHDKGDKIKLTSDTYAKNIPLIAKQQIVNSVNYN